MTAAAANSSGPSASPSGSVADATSPAGVGTQADAAKASTSNGIGGVPNTASGGEGGGEKATVGEGSGGGSVPAQGKNAKKNRRKRQNKRMAGTAAKADDVATPPEDGASSSRVEADESVGPVGDAGENAGDMERPTSSVAGKVQSGSSDDSGGVGDSCAVDAGDSADGTQWKVAGAPTTVIEDDRDDLVVPGTTDSTTPITGSGPVVPVVPEVPVASEVPEASQAPVVSVVPKVSVVLEVPVVPEAPVVPEVPVVTDVPAEPVAPVVPEASEVPIVPVVPKVPVVAEVPKDSEVPVVSEVPAVTDVPVVPEDSEVPIASEVPEVPKVPVVHVISEVPVVTEMPAVPDVPVVPEASEASEVPAVPVVPKVPVVTEVPVVSIVSEVPKHSEMPVVTELPVVTDVPVVPEKTGVPEVLVVPDVPVVSEVPVVSVVPDVPVIPEAPVVPVVTEESGAKEESEATPVVAAGFVGPQPAVVAVHVPEIISPQPAGADSSSERRGRSENTPVDDDVSSHEQGGVEGNTVAADMPLPGVRFGGRVGRWVALGLRKLGVVVAPQAAIQLRGWRQQPRIVLIGRAVAMVMLVCIVGSVLLPRSASPCRASTLSEGDPLFRPGECVEGGGYWLPRLFGFGGAPRFSVTAGGGIAVRDPRRFEEHIVFADVTSDERGGGLFCSAETLARKIAGKGEAAYGGRVTADGKLEIGSGFFCTVHTTPAPTKSMIKRLRQAHGGKAHIRYSRGSWHLLDADGEIVWTAPRDAQEGSGGQGKDKVEVSTSKQGKGKKGETKTAPKRKMGSKRDGVPKVEQTPVEGDSDGSSIGWFGWGSFWK